MMNFLNDENCIFSHNTGGNDLVNGHANDTLPLKLMDNYFSQIICVTAALKKLLLKS